MWPCNSHGRLKHLPHRLHLQPSLCVLYRGGTDEVIIRMVVPKQIHLDGWFKRKGKLQGWIKRGWIKGAGTWQTKRWGTDVNEWWQNVGSALNLTMFNKNLTGVLSYLMCMLSAGIETYTLSQWGHFRAFWSFTLRCVCRCLAKLLDVLYPFPHSGQTWLPLVDIEHSCGDSGCRLSTSDRSVFMSVAVRKTFRSTVICGRLSLDAVPSSGWVASSAAVGEVCPGWTHDAVAVAATKPPKFKVLGWRAWLPFMDRFSTEVSI